MLEQKIIVLKEIKLDNYTQVEIKYNLEGKQTRQLHTFIRLNYKETCYSEASKFKST
jgi:hypothetical protein